MHVGGRAPLPRIGWAAQASAERPTRGRRQPLPRVLPALDFEPFDEDGDDNVAPAFDNADLLDLLMALTSFRHLIDTRAL